MSIRNGSLGFIVFVAATGVALASPNDPIKPQVEGRESSPVAREFHLPEKSAERDGTVPLLPMRSKDEMVETADYLSIFVADALRFFLNRLIVPLNLQEMLSISLDFPNQRAGNRVK